jgi:alpha-tubulin suppressor-like RCC1 family protein
VAAGPYHTLAIKSDGTLWGWGVNWGGQLGDGTTENKTVPTQIGTDSHWATVVAGGWHSLALKDDGTLWAWGINSNGQLGNGTVGGNSWSPVQIGSASDWAGVATGNSHVIAVKGNGTLWAWGNNYFGQLGDGTTVDRFTPVQIGSDNGWTTLIAGSSSSLALKGDGTLWGWGNNSYGQLGDGETGNRNAPVPIQ